RVEVLACGPTGAVQSLYEWLRVGPPAARVDTVEIGEADCQSDLPDAFTTG
ncbi:MAG: acylphosphatase, partial [Gammaproteobacteria bacterium]